MNDDVIALMESDDQKNMNIGQELERLSGDNYVSFIKLSKSGQYLAVGIETNNIKANYQVWYVCYIFLMDYMTINQLIHFQR